MERLATTRGLGDRALEAGLCGGGGGGTLHLGGLGGVGRARGRR